MRASFVPGTYSAVFSAPLRITRAQHDRLAAALAGALGRLFDLFDVASPFVGGAAAGTGNGNPIGAGFGNPLTDIAAYPQGRPLMR